MLSFLGLKVVKTLANKHKYRQALQQIRHYLSFKSKIQVQENEYVLTLKHNAFQLNLAKNHNYLHTNYYNLPLFASQDWQLLDICYQCLMILRESFPSALAIQLVTDQQSKQITEFIAKKEEEFNRRVNTHLKVIVEQNSHLDSEEIQQLIYLTAQHYSRKNKSLALKTLLLKMDESNMENFSESWIQTLNSLQQAQHKRVVSDIVKKIKSLHFDLSKSKENRMKNANMINQKEQLFQPLKLNALVFQLKESYGLERICTLLSAVINQPENNQLLIKIQKTVTLITNRFIDNYYEEASIYCNEFCGCIKAYWYRRGKVINESILKALEKKENQLNGGSRAKLLSSRKF